MRPSENINPNQERSCVQDKRFGGSGMSDGSIVGGVSAVCKCMVLALAALFVVNACGVVTNWGEMGLLYSSPLELYHALTAVNGVVGGME